MIALAGSLAASACSAPVFQCETTEDCAGRAGGSCEASGYCSFPDDACASGRRYGEFAPEAFAEACVAPDAGTSSTSSPSSSATASGSTSGSGTTPLPYTSSSSSTTPSTTVSTTSAVTLSDTATDSGETTSGATETQGQSADSSTGPRTPTTVVVPASFAACTNSIDNDPVACEASTGTQGMSVDSENTGTMNAATTAYVAFDLADVPPGAELLEVELRLTTTDEINAESTTQTGEIWRTVAFTQESLSMGKPALVGDAALAADLGGATASQLVVWALPTDLDLSGTLYLAVVATTAEGVDYWNTEGLAPPELALVFAGR